MNYDLVALSGLVLSSFPFSLYLLNLSAYRPIPVPPSGSELWKPLSVLIPARNEEANIRATLEAILANRSRLFEVIVLDDHSSDRTADIVAEIASHDRRVRLEEAAPLPPGWCGKQHACYQLAKLARYPSLLFLDADVRLAPDALLRLVSFLRSRGIDLASGVPRQELETFSEKLLLPLIHTILLGFLAIPLMRRTRWPAMSGGCGQLFIASKAAYESCGGHSSIKESLHDGLKLPRVFRAAGFKTDLFDATDLAVCRMYRTNRDTWRGLEKNATEALAAPGTIGPMTLLLLGGQVLPFLLLLMMNRLSDFGFACAFTAAITALVPRVISASHFRQPLSTVLLHPIGVFALVLIQWRALAKRILGLPAEWKGRTYPPPAALAKTFLLASFLTLVSANAGDLPASIDLKDQFDTPQHLSFPADRFTLLTVADRKGSEDVDQWIAALKPRYAGRIDFRGIAQVSSVPGFLQSHVRKKFQELRKYPVMMDWDGQTCAKLSFKPGVANVLLVDRAGKILARFEGAADEKKVLALTSLLDQHLPARPSP